MDILIVMSHMGAGGAQKVVADLANRWSKKGFTVGLATSYGIDDKVALCENISRIYLSKLPTENDILKINFICSLIKLRKIIIDLKPKYIFSFICPSNIKTILACSGIKTPKLIISERNNIILQTFPKYIKYARKILYKYSDVVTANSIGSAECMKHFVPVNKIHFIPNPVCIPNIDIDKKMILQKKELKLLYVGRLVAQKKVEIILHAINQLLKQGYTFTLTIAGDGPLMPQIKDFCVNNNIEQYINIVGHVEDVNKYYLDSDIFVLCSDYEGTSNALLEAMSYGLTCIVSNNANISSRIIVDQKNGIVLKNNNEVELAKILLDLLKNKNLLNIYGREARETCKKYDSETVYLLWDSLLA